MVMCKLDETLVDKIIDGMRGIEETKPGGGPSFFPSEAGDGLRKIYFRRTEEPYTEKSDPRFSVILEFGNVIHGMIENMYKTSGLYLGHEVRIYDKESKVSGRIDIVIKEDEQMVPVEIKSISTRGWSYIKKAPKPEHVAQVTIYMKELGADHGYIHYMDKNDCSQMVWRVEYDQEEYERIVYRFKKVEKFVEDGELPPKCDGCKSPTGYPAEYCRWRGRCW